MSQIPAFVHQHLSSIAHHEESGGLLLAASSLTNRYWNGSLWYFSDPNMAPNVEHCQAGTELQSGVSDAAWIKDRKLLAVTDSGGVLMWELSEDWSTFTLWAQPVEHDDVVSSLSVHSRKNSAVTGSYDKQVKVWDLEECCSVFTCKGHTDIVLSVNYNPVEEDLFVSCSQDGCVLLWDTRKDKPARVLQAGILPTSVAWLPGNTHEVAVGTETGNIGIIDTRTGKLLTSTTRGPHTRAVSKILFSATQPKWLATSSKDSSVAVTQITDGSNLNTIWRAADHKDFVRGLSWQPNSNRLYSCGWDLAVHSYNVTPQNVINGDCGKSVSEEERMVTSPSTVS